MEVNPNSQPSYPCRPPQLPRVPIARSELLAMLRERGWRLPIPVVEAPEECGQVVEVLTETSSHLLSLARVRLSPDWPVTAAGACAAVWRYRATCVAHGHVCGCEAQTHWPRTLLSPSHARACALSAKLCMCRPPRNRASWRSRGTIPAGAHVGLQVTTCTRTRPPTSSPTACCDWPLLTRRRGASRVAQLHGSTE